MILADIKEIIAVDDLTIIVKTRSWELAQKVAIEAGNILLAQFPSGSSVEVHYRRGIRTRSIHVER